MVFSVSRNSLNALAECIQSVDPVEVCARIIRNSMAKYDLGLDDKFCDAHELKDACCNMTIPGPVLRFLGVLYNFYPEFYPKAAQSVLNQEEHASDLEVENYEENQEGDNDNEETNRSGQFSTQ